MLLLLFFFFFLIVSDYSIAAAKRKLFKSEERTNNKNVCSCVCSLCAKETNLYRREILSSKESPQKEQKSPFFTKSCLGKRAERSFFFTFFFLFSLFSLLFFKRERETLLKRKSPLTYTVERERGVLGSVVTHHGRNLSVRVRVLPRRKRVRR